MKIESVSSKKICPVIKDLHAPDSACFVDKSIAETFVLDLLLRLHVAALPA
jgi:hypothetical protein